MSRGGRIGVIVGLALLLPLLALGVGLTLLAATEGGARWTLGQLDRFGVEVERVEGRLLGPLDLHGVAFRSPTLEVEVERAELRWAPRALLARQVSVEALHLEGLQVVLAEADPPPPDEPAPDAVELPEIDLPVAVDVASLRIDGMRLERLGADPLELELAELTGSLAFRDGELQVRELALRDPLADLELAGTVLLRGDYPLDLSLGWRADIPGEGELPALAGSGAVTGSVADLSSRLTLTSPAEVAIEAGATGLPGVPTWWVTASAQRAALAPFLNEPPLEWVSLEADARGVGGELAANLAFEGGHGGGDSDGEQDAAGQSAVGPQAQDPPLSALSGSLAVQGSEGVFALEALALRALFPDGEVAVEGRGSLAAQDGGSAQVDLDWSVAFGELPTLMGRSGIDATQARIRTETLVDAPFPARLVAGVDDPTEELRWSAELEIPDAFLPAIDPEWPELRLAAALSARGDLARIESSGRVDADLAGERFALALQARGDLEASRFTVDELTLRPEAGGLLSARADVDLAGDEPRFDASGEWSEIARALTPDTLQPQVVRSEAGSFSVSGTAGAWAARLGASVQLDDTPEVAVRLEGRGSDEDFLLDELTLTGEGVAGALRGRVAWSPGLAWDLVAEGVEVELAPFQAPVGGRVSLALLTAGALEEEGVQATLEIPGAVWEEDQRRVELQGAGGLSGDTIRVEALDVRSGPNHLHLAGVLDDQWALTWRIEAPDLSEGPGLEGMVMGEGSVSGPLQRPVVQATLEAEGVALLEAEGVTGVEAEEVALAEAQGGAVPNAQGGARLDRARLDATVDLTDGSPSHVRVEFVATPAPDAPQVEGSLTGEGFLAGHRLEASAALGSGEYLDLVLSGALELPAPEAGTQATRGAEPPQAHPDEPSSLPRWHGQLLDLQAGLGAAGEWALEAPASLRLSPPQALALSLLCLGSEGAAACVEGVWSPEEGGEGRADLRGVELDRFAELLPPGLVIQGVAGARGEFAIDPEGRATVRAQGGIEGGRIRHPTGFGTEEERVMDEAGLRLLVSPDGRLEGEVALRLDDGSFLVGSVATEPDPAGPGTLLSGDVAVELQDRGLLAATSEELWNSSGVVRGALTLGGTAEVPLLSGELALEEGRVEVPEFGLRLEGLELRATDDGPDAWRFTGDVRSGPGALALEGSAFLPRPDRPGSVRAQVSGRDFQALDSSLGRVRITPSLRLQADAGGIEVEGTVRVPWAELTPGDVEGMVARSPDVVVVGLEEEEVPARAAAPPGLTARIRVEMGDSVSFDGFGVEGRITGAVTLVEEPGRLTTGQGEFRLVDGTFTAARQRLTIERGHLIFSDRPIEDPGLDLRITRQTRDILAIMEVRGTALEPEVTVFSDPVLSQADAMAYLLIGRPVRGTGERDGDLMEEVATSMGLAGGAAVLDRIGPSLGLAEARIERGETLTDAALVVGTYVTPRLFVSYGLGLFEDAVSTLRLRYEITDRWSFRTESGRETGADVLFSRER